MTNVVLLFHLYRSFSTLVFGHWLGSRRVYSNSKILSTRTALSTSLSGLQIRTLRIDTLFFAMLEPDLIFTWSCLAVRGMMYYKRALILQAQQEGASIAGTEFSSVS